MRRHKSSTDEGGETRNGLGDETRDESIRRQFTSPPQETHCANCTGDEKTAAQNHQFACSAAGRSSVSCADAVGSTSAVGDGDAGRVSSAVLLGLCIGSGGACQSPGK